MKTKNNRAKWLNEPRQKKHKENHIRTHHNQIAGNQ